MLILQNLMLIMIIVIIIMSNSMVLKLTVSAISIKESVIIAIIQAKTERLHTVFVIKIQKPKEIPVVFHNESDCDCHFIIKQLTDDFDGQFEGLQQMLKNT